MNCGRSQLPRDITTVLYACHFSIRIPIAPIPDGNRTQPTTSTRTKGASCEYVTKVDGSINASAIAALQFGADEMDAGATQLLKLYAGDRDVIFLDIRIVFQNFRYGNKALITLECDLPESLDADLNTIANMFGCI